MPIWDKITLRKRCIIECINELLLSDKSFLIDTPFFWRGQKVKG